MMKKKNEAKRKKKPWPTKDAMEQIYEMNLWGTDHSDFYSGIGSHHPEIVQPYLETVTSFLNSFDEPLSVCDLGCGDFNVGKELVRHSKRFFGVDIVTDLIEHNREKFKAENLSFHCLDIAKDDLPSADCALLRQVLQHLSNMEVKSITKKLAAFKYVIVTEHVPGGDFVPNMDIISGQGTRLKKNSGVNLLAPPFNFEVKEEKQLLSIPAKDHQGVIVTTLFTVF